MSRAGGRRVVEDARVRRLEGAGGGEREEEEEVIEMMGVRYKPETKHNSTRSTQQKEGKKCNNQTSTILLFVSPITALAPFCAG